MEIIDLSLHDHRFWCGSHASCVDMMRVDIEIEGRILMPSVSLNQGWKKLDASLLSAIPRDLGDLISSWGESDYDVMSEDLFGRKVCGDERFRWTVRYFAQNRGSKSDIAVAFYHLGEAGSVFVRVEYVILQCDSIIITEDVLDRSWDSLKIAPLIPMNQRDTYLEPPSALPI